jgi:cytosine/adenosine deaminase-related metal-dependent hydrolase
LGADGAASNEAGELGMELREALLFARLLGGPGALTARQALELATVHGARCLGREAEIGSLEPGKLADVALWRVDDLAHAGVSDPVAALVFGPAPRVELLLVGGKPLVRDAELVTADTGGIAREIAGASRRLAEKAKEVAL